MKDKITQLLINRTKKYLAKTNPKIIAVVGSVGKTSTTQALAKILSEKFNVKTTYANYNTDLGVLLTIFDEKVQSSRILWLITILKIYIKSQGRPKHDVYVLELGTDKPGDIEKFAYLSPDYGLVTAISPEHMEFFESIEAVAKEEMSLTDFCKKTYIASDVPENYIAKYSKGETIKVDQPGIAELLKVDFSQKGVEVDIKIADEITSFHSGLVAKHLIKGLLAPALIARELGMSIDEIKSGLEKITSLPGRMLILDGINESVIIDDTYNASPEAVKAALDTLYEFKGNKKIALLGMMNELGNSSESMHTQIGEYCDPSKLDLIITLGADANSFIAPSATKRGCRVMMATNAIEAAELIRPEMTPGTVLLAKGSQNGVYAEESVKRLLADRNDAAKLVRQSSYWPAKKKKYFSEVSVK